MHDVPSQGMRKLLQELDQTKLTKKNFRTMCKENPYAYLCDQID